MSRRVTVITGASRGIGYTLANQLAEAGHTVVGIGRNAPDTAIPGEFVKVDLSKLDDTREALADIAGRYKVDSVVHNAGAPFPQPLQDVTPENLQAALDINLRPALLCAQAFLPGMLAAKRGRIVNVTSRAALGKENRTSYSAAKAGLIGFTRTWALELAASGVTVNAVAPGAVFTELFQNNNSPAAQQALVEKIPMKRFGTPEEITAAIMYFLSDAASFTTGQVLYVCGGSSVGHVPS